MMHMTMLQKIYRENTHCPGAELVKVMGRDSILMLNYFDKIRK